MVAMATDVRVILIKLADRLHNMRTLEALPKQKQLGQGARDARDLRAARPSPRDPRDQVGAGGPGLRAAAPAQVRRDQEARRPAARPSASATSPRPGDFLEGELAKVGIEAEISGRAKHFYSIYSKMTKKGREFNEIYDLTAMRVIVGSVKDCYGAIGIIHSIWKPLPGRFKDFVATPEAEPLLGAAHDRDRARGTAAGDPDPDAGHARARRVRDRRPRDLQGGLGRPQGATTERDKMTWLRQLLEAEGDQEPAEFLESLKVDLFEDEVFVFTPARRGQEPLRRLDAARLRLRRPHRRRPPLRRREGQRQDRAAPLPAARAATSSRSSPPSRSAGPRATGWRWCARAAPATRSAPSSPASAARTPSAGAARSCRRRCESAACRCSGSPARRCSPTSSARWASARPTTSTSRSARARSRRRRSPTKVFQRLKQGEAVAGRRDRGAPGQRPRGPRRAPAPHAGRDRLRDRSQGRRRRDGAPGQVLPAGPRRRDRRVRLARPRDHDPPRGLQERGRAAQGPGAVHRGRVGRRQLHLLPRRAPGRRLGSHPPARGPLAGVLRGAASTSSRPSARPSTRWSRTGSWSRSGTPTSYASAIGRLRNVESVFDAYRVTPTDSVPGDARMTPARPPVSVVVPFGGGDADQRCGPRARAHPDGRRRRADRGRQLGRRRRAAGRVARVVPATAERSSYHARNAGAAAGGGEWILFMDDDCTPEPRTPGRLLARARRRRRRGHRRGDPGRGRPAGAGRPLRAGPQGPEPDRRPLRPRADDRRNGEPAGSPRGVRSARRLH